MGLKGSIGLRRWLTNPTSNPIEPSSNPTLNPTSNPHSNPFEPHSNPIRTQHQTLLKLIQTQYILYFFLIPEKQALSDEKDKAVDIL